jgi:hypothetical protein
MRPKDLREKRSLPSIETPSIQNQDKEISSPSTKDSSYCELQRKHIKDISHQKLLAESRDRETFETDEIFRNDDDEDRSNDSYEDPIDPKKITLSSDVLHLFGSVDDKDLIDKSGLGIEPKMNSFRKANHFDGSNAKQDNSNLITSNYNPSGGHKLQTAIKNTLAIDQWIETVYNLHRSKPVVSFEYSHPMPSMDETFSIFPETMREALEASENENGDGLETSLDPTLDVSLEDYIRMVCAILDIPVRDGYLIESLHYLFHAYVEVRSKKDAISDYKVSGF